LVASHVKTGGENLNPNTFNRRRRVKTIKIKDIMVPIEEYATVSQDATLYEALLALEEAQEKQGTVSYKHRAVLVYDEKREIVGKISQLDLIKGLEKGYSKVEELQRASFSGYSKSFLESLAKTHNLWNEPMRDICKKGVNIKAKDIMYKPAEGEFVQSDASLDKAIHLLVMGRHQSLLVSEKGKITGILRLTDVFKEICDEMKKCAF
jgi:CBS domain-containing protein